MPGTMRQTIFGTCDGTGAAINVCLGFVPSYVRVINVEDAGGHIIEMEWFGVMQSLASAVDEGFKIDNGTKSLLAGTGITAYNGGDEIQYDKTSSARWETVASFPGGSSVEEVYVDGTYWRDAGTDAAYKCFGDRACPEKYHGAKVVTTPGFSIAADADLNADGEQLIWMAVE